MDLLLGMPGVAVAALVLWGATSAGAHRQVAGRVAMEPREPERQVRQTQVAVGEEMELEPAPLALVGPV